MTEGKYIVIEGNDGTGKSTQVENIRARLAEQGIESLEFHEPAGVPVADAIRDVIKNGRLERDAETNLLLFTATRHEIWQKAERELAIGKWVVAARSYFSALAYQGYGEGLSIDLITDTTKTFTSERYVRPDLALVLTIDNQARSSRIANRGEIENPDTFESRDDSFQRRVNEGYRTIARERNLPTIDASGSIESVTDTIWHDHVTQLLP